MNPLKSFVIVSFVLALSILTIANHSTNTSVVLLGILAIVMVQIIFKNREYNEMIEELRHLSRQIKQLNNSILSITRRSHEAEPEEK